MTPKPKTAREKYIGKIANDESLRIDDIPAKTPTEKYLKEIASRSGGGSGIFWVEVSGTTTDGVHMTFEKASHTAAEIIEAYNQFEFPILRALVLKTSSSTAFAAVFMGAVTTPDHMTAVFSAGNAGRQLVVDEQGNVTD